MSPRSPEAHRALVESYLDDLPFASELGELTAAVRYSLDGGGKRIRPVLCLAAGEAAGAPLRAVLPAAAALELIHTFSLVHDDLPALDDDDVRRGRASTHIEFGEAIGVLAGDALLAEAFRLALSYPTPAVARELAGATLGMIGGQYLDLASRRHDLEALNRLKTGRLFEAAIGCALWVAEVPETEQGPWRAFGRELGPLFQTVDDILDGDGLAALYGVEEARALADAAAERAQARLAAIPADTSVLSEIVAGLAARTS
jgi:geranylgeranyl diphosphate synthase type II